MICLYLLAVDAIPGVLVFTFLFLTWSIQPTGVTSLFLGAGGGRQGQELGKGFYSLALIYLFLFIYSFIDQHGVLSYIFSCE